MFTAPVFTTAKLQSRPRWPSAVKHIMLQPHHGTQLSNFLFKNDVCNVIGLHSGKNHM